MSLDAIDLDCNETVEWRKDCPGHATGVMYSNIASVSVNAKRASVREMATVCAASLGSCLPPGAGGPKAIKVSLNLSLLPGAIWKATQQKTVGGAGKKTGDDASTKHGGLHASCRT